jgi:hypothetical protein
LPAVNRTALAPANRTRDQRRRTVSGRPEQIRAGSRFNNVPTGRAAIIVSISGRASRTVHDLGLIRRRVRSGFMATTLSLPLWRTSSAACAA